MSDKSKGAIALALAMRQKMGQKSQGAEVCKSCGGQVSPKLNMSQGGMVDDPSLDFDDDAEEYSQGGEVGEPDEDTDDLVYSPKEEDDDEEADEGDDKKSGFLRAYMVSRKLGG